jgi:hypothetical protein
MTDDSPVRDEEKFEATPTPPTNEQKANIRKEILQTGAAHCPVDGSPLAVLDAPTDEALQTDFSVIPLHIACPKCGLQGPV